MMRDINANVYLIGMMGSGKSTVGRLLSEKLNREFIDTDDKIEEFMDYAISEIFESMGEQRFRKMEESYFLEKSQQSGLIISTGGGIVISPKNRSVLTNSTYSIYLKAHPEFLINRLKKRNKRPLLSGNQPILQKLEDIYKSRANFYEQCSNHIIDIEPLSKIDKLNKILECLN